MTGRRVRHGECLECGSDSVDGVDDVLGPGPVAIEAESSAVGPDAGGDVEHPVADGFGCGSAELSGAADVLGPDEEVVGGEAEVHPGPGC